MKRQTWLILCTYFLDVLHCYENIAIKKPAYQQNPYFPDNDTFAARCPTTGFYGSNCSNPCPDINCRYCHLEAGYCQGYCEKTFFGKNCSQKCNLRCLNQDCHHETGECVDKQKHNNLPTIIVLLGSIVAVAVLLITILFRRTRRKTLKLRTTTNKDDYEAQTSIQYH
uniref:Scavenger receptor class F member 2 n=1 Tax=Magallana gigas TaxID=29159 RepID=A0A8W8NX87_MAGGI